MNSSINPLISKVMAEHIKAVEDFFVFNSSELEAVAGRLAACFQAGRKLLVCGNGGSACDAQHIAGEFVGRFVGNRQALPAIALNTDGGVLTAIANDFGYDTVFSRQIEALGNPGDVLIALSTSGSSPNILAALKEAAKRDMYTVLLTGAKGKGSENMADSVLVVPSEKTARAQEVHIVVLHTLATLVEEVLFENRGAA